MEVIIIVDGKQVSMDVSVAQKHINTWNVMHILQQPVELLEADVAVPL